MKVIITGITGFVGKNLKSFLPLSNFDIVDFKRENFKIIDQHVFQNVNSIVHLAGKAHDLKKVNSPQEYYEINFELTKKLYNAFLKSDAKKFIFISSVKAAADALDKPLSETFISNPQTDYGKSKLMAEEYIQNQPLPKGKSYYILRPCMIHGPGNKGNLNLLFKLVKKGIPYPLAAFNNKRSFLSVENLCFVIKEIIMNDNIESGVYQVADDKALSTNEVISILSASLNNKPRLWKISPYIIKGFAKLGDLLHLPLTTERLIKLTESYIVSNQKVKEALNKEFPITAIEGLKITANSFDKD